MILKDVAAAALSGRKVYVSGRVKKQVVVHQDAAFVRACKAAQTVEDEGLASSTGTEKHGDAGLGLELNIQLEWSCIGNRRKSFHEPGMDAHQNSCTGRPEPRASASGSLSLCGLSSSQLMRNVSIKIRAPAETEPRAQAVRSVMLPKSIRRPYAVVAGRFPRDR